tara:strand:- start:3843 stop:4184 length:342 start_codon:yes stop_codon:yes gene_type:complete
MEEQVSLQVKHLYKIYYNVMMQLAMKYKVRNTIDKKFGIDSEEHELMSKDIEELLESFKGLKSVLALRTGIENESEMLQKLEEYIKGDPYYILTEKYFEHNDSFDSKNTKEVN